MADPVAGDAGSVPVPRAAERHRVTRESDVAVRIGLDQPAPSSVHTGLPFFDHMLSQLGKHGSLDLEVKATGDLDVDAHHTVEDVGITFGEALGAALGDKVGIRRFASVSLPLDEALVDVALDCSGRPFLRYDVAFAEGSAALGQPGFDPQLAEEFWRAAVNGAGITLHISLRYGRNPHHILEASFKAVARALRDAVLVEGGGVPSTKGTL
jgi:imidazoleglycerol-phosphate dehydratase